MEVIEVPESKSFKIQGFVCGGDILYCYREQDSTLIFFDVHSKAVAASWRFYEGRAALKNAACVTSFGKFVVVCFALKEDLHICLYDTIAHKAGPHSVFGLSEEITPISALSVLQSGPVWMMLAVGCEEGDCFLVRHSVNVGFANSNNGVWTELETFCLNAFLPPNTVAIAAPHVAAGLQEDFKITSFAYHEPFIAVGYSHGSVIIHRLYSKGLSLRCTTSSASEESVKFLSFPSASRLIVGRASKIHMVQLYLQNEVLESKDAASRALRDEEQLVWVTSSGGLVSYATVDQITGAVYFSAEPYLDLPFDFTAPTMLVSPASHSPVAVDAFYLAITSDRATTLRVSGGGKLVCVEGLPPSAKVCREILSAGRGALEPPLSRSLRKHVIDAGMMPAGKSDMSDDEVAEFIMEVCVEKDCIGVLEDVITTGSVAARAAHLREWTKKFAKKTIENCDVSLRKHLDNTKNVAPDEKTLMELEMGLARLGSIYRLEESLSQSSMGNEVQASAAKTLAHAQRLEVGIWYISSGLFLLQDFFPVSMIERTSRARRQVLSRSTGANSSFLFCDYLWHLMLHGSGVPSDQTNLWPPSSFQLILDAMVKVTDPPVPFHLKYSVLLYALLDASMLGDDSQKDTIERCASRFCEVLAVPAVVERRTRAFWMIDRSFDLDKAALEFADLGFPDWHSKLGITVVQRLLQGRNYLGALTALQRCKSESLEDVEVFVSTYVACGMIHEALAFCRTHESSSVFLSLLTRCDRQGALSDVISLPLNATEETALFSFLGLLATSSKREERDLLVIYLLLRNRVMEAKQLYARIREHLGGDKQKAMDQLINSALVDQPMCIVKPTEENASYLCASLFNPPKVEKLETMNVQPMELEEEEEEEEEEEQEIPDLMEIDQKYNEIDDILNASTIQRKPFDSSSSAYQTGVLSTPVKRLVKF